VKPLSVNGILLLYYQPLTSGAATISEHVASIPTHSRFPVWTVNTGLGFPGGLATLRFKAVVLHYSLFGPPPLFGSWPDGLDRRFLNYLDGCVDSYKIAFFQDEHHFCGARFAFLDRYGVNCVYTLLDQKYWEQVYLRHTTVETLVHTLTGYVSRALVERAAAMTKPDAARRIDVGYRARRLPFYMGRGGQEKTAIAEGFLARAADSGLRFDVATSEQSRIYGDAWWEFLSDCRAVLGVEAGVSIFDLDDSARLACDRLLASEPALTFEQAYDRLLSQWDGRIEYRTISPRHFEAAALRVCQILFEGSYNGILQPWLHYIPLKKDFSNFDEVLRAFGNDDTRRTITDNAYRDLIASGRWSYERFVADFDERLIARGLAPSMSSTERAEVSARLRRGELFRHLKGRLRAARRIRFRGRDRMVAGVRRLLAGAR